MNADDKLSFVTAKQQRVDNWPEVVEWQIEEYGDELVDLNRDQMLLGRNAEGEVLTPSYLEDPYFPTQEAAQAYASMKYGL